MRDGLCGRRRGLMVIEPVLLLLLRMRSTGGIRCPEATAPRGSMKGAPRALGEVSCGRGGDKSMGNMVVCMDGGWEA